MLALSSEESDSWEYGIIVRSIRVCYIQPNLQHPWWSPTPRPGEEPNIKASSKSSKPSGTRKVQVLECHAPGNRAIKSILRSPGFAEDIKKGITLKAIIPIIIASAGRPGTQFSRRS